MPFAISQEQLFAHLFLSLTIVKGRKGTGSQKPPVRDRCNFAHGGMHNPAMQDLWHEQESLLTD